jgi:NAD(P)-dependent dehydrogenase (short-subunit alcohol dehydrogenase family)
MNPSIGPIAARLADRVFLVTGAASGIGSAISSRIVAEGGKVVLLDRREQAVTEQAVQLGPSAIAVAGDVTDLGSMQSVVATTLARFGSLDGLVHSAAALSADGTVVNLDLAQWHLEIDVCLTGAFLASKCVVPELVKSGGGSIVFVSSVFGHIGINQSVAYCTAKAGLINLAKAMAIDHGGDGIRVNCISPGPVASDGVLQRWPSIEAANEGLGPRTLLGRISHPDEIAAAVGFLLSDDSLFCTGSDMLIDGGYSAR